MVRARRVNEKAPPVSVALSKEQRDAFDAEARRRGLGISTTIRTLAVERVRDIREEDQRRRALRWQTERLRVLADRIDTEGFEEASQAEIDAIFDGAEALDRRQTRHRR